MTFVILGPDDDDNNEQYQARDLSPREILEQAYDYLAPTYITSEGGVAVTGWIRGQWFLDEAVFSGDEVKVGDTTVPHMVLATRVCSVGAMLLATDMLGANSNYDYERVGSYASQDPNFAAALRLLAEAIKAARPDELAYNVPTLAGWNSDQLVSAVVQWNDNTECSHEDLLDIFQTAIKSAIKLEEKG